MPDYTIDAKTNCWLWNGRVDGYGRPLWSEHGVVYRPHLMNYLKMYGRYPTRVTLTCGHDKCVNPSHMVALKFKAAPRMPHKVMRQAEAESRADAELKELDQWAANLLNKETKNESPNTDEH